MIRDLLAELPALLLTLVVGILVVVALHAIHDCLMGRW